jgi:UDPglucose 6-dehydrogenase
MKISIFGSGYVGLVTGACLADMGHNVMCVDTDPKKIKMLKSGQSPIFEPGLERKLSFNADAGRLHFTTSAKEGINHANVIFIAVGTPSDEDGSADLTYVLAVANTIGQHIERHTVVINKSTVPVGSADLVRAEVQKALEARGSNITFDVASNPEFLREGSAIKDFETPDRIIIGTENAQTTEMIRDVYRPFIRKNDRFIEMDIRSAELTKYAANAMLATKISFMNEIANIAESVGADIENVRIGIGSDNRIGYEFIYPGVGYGGSCFPKDVKALKNIAQKSGIEPHIVASVENVNDNQKSLLPRKIMEHFKGDIKGKTFALWGLAFKPNTDDMREAPARVVMEALWAQGAKVTAYDPQAAKECTRIYGERDDLSYAKTAMDCLENTDGLIVVTEWKEFRAVDGEDLKSKMNEAVIFDGRNIYDPDQMKRMGIPYYSVGRKAN